MTYENMTAREIDEAISHALFGTKPLSDREKARGIIFRPDQYSTRIEYAFEVVEAMRERGYQFRLATIGKFVSAAFILHQKKVDVIGEEISPARAIVIAALRALDA